MDYKIFFNEIRSLGWGEGVHRRLVRSERWDVVSWGRNGHTKTDITLRVDAFQSTSKKIYQDGQTETLMPIYKRPEARKKKQVVLGREIMDGPVFQPL